MGIYGDPWHITATFLQDTRHASHLHDDALMFASALVQPNTAIHVMAINARLHWVHQPGSELFVVHNYERNIVAPGFMPLQARALIVKFNRLFRF